MIDVVVVGSGMGAAAVCRGLDGAGLRSLVLEAGAELTPRGGHLASRVPRSAWRDLVGALVRPAVLSLGAPVDGCPASTHGIRDGVNDLPGLGRAPFVGGSGLFWSGVVLPEPGLLEADEVERARAWLGADVVRGSARQERLQLQAGLCPVPLAWAEDLGWCGPDRLGGPGFAPLPGHAATGLVTEGDRVVGVRLGAREVRARAVVVAAGVVGSVGLLWPHRGAIPELGKRLAHHPAAVAQVCVPGWRDLDARPVALCDPDGPEHTLFLAEPPWMLEGRVDPVTTLSVYAYARLEPEEGRRVLFDERLDAAGLPLPRFDIPCTSQEEDATRRALERARAWVVRLGRPLPTGRARVLPRGGDQHMAGGVPCSASGRVHGLRDLWVAGAAAIPVPISTHPVLTIVALGARVAGDILASLAR